MPAQQPDPAPTLSLAAFRALRYAPNIALEGVLAPPYDVIEADEAVALAGADEHNFVRLILPESAEAAAATLRAWVAGGVLVRDLDPAVYVYEQVTSDGTLQRGLLGALGLTDPESHVVLTHEYVMPGPVEGRTRLMRTTEANLEPIWLLYRGADGSAARLVVATAETPPLAEAHTADGVRHRLWALTDPDALADLAADLAGRQALIVDGHHRHEAYRRLQEEHEGPGPWDRGLALLVDLETYPPDLGGIHRHVDRLTPAEAAAAANRQPGLSASSTDESWASVLAAAEQGTLVLVGQSGEVVVVTVEDRPAIDAVITATLDDPELPAAWRALDTVLLHHVLLPAWGMAEADVTYHHDAAHAVELARDNGGTAVLMAPVDVRDVFALAETGVRMPRKSTSFGPKPRSGLVLRTFADDQ